VLSIAAKHGHLELVKSLVFSGAQLESQNEVSGTHAQLTNDRCMMVFALQDSKTALLWACESSHLEVVKFLVKIGADMEKQDKVHIDPSTLLHANVSYSADRRV
jgi:ankyrin repeat protein